MEAELAMRAMISYQRLGRYNCEIQFKAQVDAESSAIFVERTKARINTFLATNLHTLGNRAGGNMSLQHRQKAESTNAVSGA